LQAFLPLLIVPVVLIMDVPQRILELFNKTNVKLSELEWYWRIVLALGKWPLIVVVLFFIYHAIRKHNKEELLKQNLGLIVWHSYFGYWFCRYVLNYQIVSLTRVPIPVQFELVWKGLFKKYEYMEGVTESNNTDNITVENIQSEPYTPTVNLILSDTYPLDDWKSKIPASTINYSTIIINRSGERGVRYYSKEFVANVAMAVHNLPCTVININIFGTVNAAHVYHIVNEVFKTGGRDGLKQIKVFQQTSGSWAFEGDKYKVIRIGAQ